MLLHILTPTGISFLPIKEAWRSVDPRVVAGENSHKILSTLEDQEGQVKLVFRLMETIEALLLI